MAVLGSVDSTAAVVAGACEDDIRPPVTPVVAGTLVSVVSCGAGPRYIPQSLSKLLDGSDLFLRDLSLCKGSKKSRMLGL